MRLFLFSGVVFFLVGTTVGCSGGGSASTSTTSTTTTTTSAASPDFSLGIAPSTIAVTPGGPAQTLAIAVSAINGFTGLVNIAVGSLPGGITVSPMSISMAAGTVQQITVIAGSTAAPGTASVSLQGVSASLTHSLSEPLTIGAVSVSTTATLSGTAFDFGNNLVGNILTQSVVTVTNNGAAALTMSPSLSGDGSYALVASGSCGSQLAPGTSCPVLVSYKPTDVSGSASQSALLNLGLGGVPAGTAETVLLSGASAALSAGQVTSTDNPQVALYTMTLPFPGTMTVNFGKDTTYGTKTWSQATHTTGGQISIFVAGMLANSTYHMQASVEFDNGIVAADIDHAFTTRAVPANMQPNLTATTTAGMTPQPGIELLDLLGGTPSGIAVTDLSGNLLWAYAAPGLAGNLIQGAKLLPNGDFLMAIGPNSTVPLGSVPAGTISEIREVNLAGDTVREITVTDLNALLVTAGCTECNVTLQSFHHDVEPLPNGHWLVLANTTMLLTATTKPALINLPNTEVLADVIVDLDPNLRPVWAWNAFNHINPNYAPVSLADLTHGNAVLYSPDDGNILFSMRNKNFVVKLDYEDGKGSGDVLWRLGWNGTLTLKNGVDPTDWHYEQHFPAYFSSNTSGVFSLGLMDNGGGRMFASNIACNTPNNLPCLYTTIPVYQIDEKAMTATLIFHQKLSATFYSYFGGSVDLLANANVEYDLCGVGKDSYIYEVTQQSTPQTVWSMHVIGTNAYRGFRLPSLYPGVQW